MDRRVFQGIFTKTKPPQWPCPRCGMSVLQIVEKTFVDDEGADSREAHSCDAWDPDWIENRFSCLLKCSNDSCGEIVTCVGTGSVEEEYGSDFDGNPTREYIEWYRPTFFQPSLVMMDIPSDAPDEVVQELKASFALFYSNPNAAANSARMAIEALLTSIGVKRFSIANGQRKPITLHNRIDSLSSKYAEVKVLLEAVKWIGNHGSHSGRLVTTETLMDAYDILEALLEELYNNSRARIMKKAQDVNKHKGPRKTNETQQAKSVGRRRRR